MYQGQFIPKLWLAELTGIEHIWKGGRERGREKGKENLEGGGGREEEREEVP